MSYNIYMERGARTIDIPRLLPKTIKEDQAMFTKLDLSLPLLFEKR